MTISENKADTFDALNTSYFYHMDYIIITVSKFDSYYQNLWEYINFI